MEEMPTPSAELDSSFATGRARISGPRTTSPRSTARSHQTRVHRTGGGPRRDPLLLLANRRTDAEGNATGWLRQRGIESQILLEVDRIPRAN